MHRPIPVGTLTRTAAGLFCALVLEAVRVSAGTLPIPNSGFEAPVLQPGTWTYNLQGWTDAGPPNNQSRFIEYISGFHAEGLQHLGLELGASVWQDLPATYKSNTTYRFAVALGNRPGFTVPGNLSTFSLTEPSGNIESKTEFDASHIAVGGFGVPRTLEVNTTLNPAFVGKTIRVRLSAGGAGRSHFDGMRLDEAPNLTVIDYYRMGEDDPGLIRSGAVASSTTKDSVGTKDLALTGGPFWSPDVSSTAATWAGSSVSLNFFQGGPYGKAPLLTTVTDNFGIEAWVKPLATSGNRCIAYNGNTGSSGWGLYQVGNTFQGLFGGVGWVGSGPVTPGTWTHVALVRTGGVARLYLNGVPAGNSSTVAPRVPAGQFAIATAPQSPGIEVLSGYLDEVRVFTIAPGQFSPANLLLNAATSIPTILAQTVQVAGTSVAVSTSFNPGGGGTAAWFEWGVLSRAYRSNTAKALYSGAVPVSFAANVGGLNPGWIYYGHATASNNLGSARGPEARFGWPAINLNGPAVVTNQFHKPYSDTGVVAFNAPLAIAAGYYHSLALRADGTVVGWGRNTSRQVNIPPAASNVVAVTAGYNHSLALRSDGTIVGWGDNTFGQAAIPAAATNVIAIVAGQSCSYALRTNGTVVAWGDSSLNKIAVPASATNVVAIAAGNSHAIALRADGMVVAWGTVSAVQINPPASATNVVSIAAGGSYSMALRADGTLVAWGSNPFGAATIPASATNIVAIAASDGVSLALRADGTLVGWGNNSDGQLNIPAAATNLVAVATGGYHTLALRADGTLLSWGLNLDNQAVSPPATIYGGLPLTVTGSVNVDVPGRYLLTYSTTNVLGGAAVATRTVVISLFEAVTRPATGVTGDAAVLNATVNPGGLATAAWFEWGPASLPYTQKTLPVGLGSGTSLLPFSSPLTGLTPGLIYHYRVLATNAVGTARGDDVRLGIPRITLNGPASLTVPWHNAYADAGATAFMAPLAIAGGEYFSLALRGNGTVIGWGWNDYGQVKIPANATNVTAIAGGFRHSLALRTNGTVFGWGNGDYGQLSIPAEATNIVSILAGEKHSLALRATGLVLGWGFNIYGALSIPGSATNVIAIAGRYNHVLALRADGTMLGWGDNGFNQLNIPAAATNVVAIAAGEQHSLALRSNGTVMAWGNNSFGQTNVPTSATNVVAIAAGKSHSLALRADGSVVVWGNNDVGQLNLPGGATNVVAIAAGGIHSLALRADGTIFAWGYNPYGEAVPPPVASYTGLPVAVSGSVDVSVPGAYTLTYSATGMFGSATAARTVIVSPYEVATQPATSVTATGATLNAAINPGGAASTAWFEWGVSGSPYTWQTPLVNVPSGSSTVPVSSPVTSLTPGVIYHFRAVATNSIGTLRGVELRFGAPVVTLKGAAVVTNECHSAYNDAGAAASAFNVPIAIGAGSLNTVALRADGTVTVWGNGTYGWLNIPASATNVVAINCGSYPCFALRNDGTIVAWGTNTWGQLNVPASATNVTAIATGYYDALALRADGTVVSWGTYPQYSTPPANLTNVVAVASGTYHFLALRGNGTVVAWGNNSNGQTDVPASATNVIGIAAGENYSLAVRRDGRIVFWGQQSLQTVIPAAATNVISVAVGRQHTLALRADGTVVAWGLNNNFGQLSVPAEATNVVAIAAGLSHSMALRADGSMVGWGLTAYGMAPTLPASSFSTLAVTMNGSVNSDATGSCSVTYTSTNALGYVGSATRTVIVADTTPPAITLLGSNPITLPVGTGFVDPGATASDACSGSVPVTATSTVDPSIPGTYSVTYKSADSSGNLAIAIRNVVVGPPAVGLASTSAAGNHGTPAAPPARLNITSKPGRGGFLLTCTHTPGVEFAVLVSSDLLLPLQDWTVLGTPTEVSPGQSELVDAPANESSSRFYRVRMAAPSATR